MKIALLGYGKMGKEIEKVVLQRNHEISFIVDAHNANYKTEELKNTCAAIEFSEPQGAVQNILKCFDANIPVVCGTTGWSDRIEEIKQRCIEENQALFYSPNFSIGVNIFFQLNRNLAQMMNNRNNYDVSIEETHHTQKLDAPSGTAITLANDIIDRIDRKTKWVNQKSVETRNVETRPGLVSTFLASTDIGITSIRKNNITGTHIVKYLSDIDGLEIKHEAKSRKGFAMGAVLAAEWIIGKKGVFTMQDMLKF